MGFRPIRESVESDLAYRLTMANQELKEGKKQAIDDFLRDPSNENRKRIKDGEYSNDIFEINIPEELNKHVLDKRNIVTEENVLDYLIELKEAILGKYP